MRRRRAKNYARSIEPNGYTVREAARRMGMSEANVRQYVGKGKLPTVASSGPLRVDENAVEHFRAAALAKFSEVVDVSEGGLASEPSRVPADSRAEEWLRTVAAANQLLDEGVQLVRRANRLLVDTMLAALPEQPPNETASATSGHSS